MDLIKVRKADDALTVALPAEIIEALGLSEDDVLAVQRVGDEIVLRRAAPEAQQTLPLDRPLSAIELMKLPLEERHRLLAAAAAEAENVYRTDRDLTDFEAFGEGDLYDDYPGEGRGLAGKV